MVVDEYFTINYELEHDHDRAKAIFQDLHLDVKEVSSGVVRALVVHSVYSWKPWQAIQAAFQASGIKGSLKCYRNTNFSEQEWESAAFWQVAIADSPLPSNTTDWEKCAECRKKSLVSRITVPYSKTIPDMKKLFSFCKGIDVVSRAGKELLESAGLTGLAFTPFDTAHRYFVFKPTNTLKSQVFPENEYEGDQSVCNLCGRYKGLSFGPYRFSRSEWDGSDFVALLGWPDFVYCTPCAYNVLQILDPSIWRSRLVVLE